MWKLIRAFMRREVQSWVRREFTKEKIQGMLWEWFGKRINTKTMIGKLAPSVRQKVLDLATVDASGNVALSAANAQELVGYVFKRTVEQMR